MDDSNAHRTIYSAYVVRSQTELYCVCLYSLGSPGGSCEGTGNTFELLHTAVIITATTKNRVVSYCVKGILSCCAIGAVGVSFLRSVIARHRTTQNWTDLGRTSDSSSTTTTPSISLPSPPARPPPHIKATTVTYKETDRFNSFVPRYHFGGTGSPCRD